MKNGYYDPISINCMQDSHDLCQHMGNNSRWCACDCHDDKCTCNEHYFSKVDRKKKQEAYDKKVKLQHHIHQIEYLVDTSLDMIPEENKKVRMNINDIRNYFTNLKELIDIE